jgi:hypothetical protein
MRSKIGTIFIIIALLISCNILASATTNSELNEEKNESTSPILYKFAYIKRAFAVGNASSGRLVGESGRIGIINFEEVTFSKLKLFPVRWEFADYYNAKAIVFGIDQEIPNGSFEFQRDWVRALIFYK